MVGGGLILVGASEPGLTESSRMWRVESTGRAGPVGEQCFIVAHTSVRVVKRDKRLTTVASMRKMPSTAKEVTVGQAKLQPCR